MNTKFFSRETRILPQMHWTWNIFGPSSTTICEFCVSLNYAILNFMKTVCPKNVWMRHCEKTLFCNFQKKTWPNLWISCLPKTRKLLFWIFLMMKIWYFWAKKLMKYDVYWLLKKSCFYLFGNGKYVLFSAKKFIERWYLLGLFELFPWYSRIWKIWFFPQCFH